MARPKQRIGIDRESRSIKGVRRSEPGHSAGTSSHEARGDEPSIETSESGGLVPETWLEDAMLHQEAEIAIPPPPPEEQPQNCTVADERVTATDVDDGQVESAPAPRDCEKGSNSAAAHEEGFDCTTCGKKLFRTWDIMEHPQLGVGICRDCRDFLFSSPYTKCAVDGSEEQCRWCGEGGQIVMCDDCDKAFCQGCIVRNFGPQDLHAIVSSVHWSCYSCNPEVLREHVQELRRFKASAKEADFFPGRRREGGKARTGRNATTFPRTGAGEGATIADLLAQEEERRRQNPGLWTKPIGKPGRRRAAPGSNKKSSFFNQTGMNKFSTKSNLTIADIVKQAAAPSQPPPITYIRPHQWLEKRQQAAERRKRAEQAAEAERLKLNITNHSNEKNFLTNYNEKKIVPDIGEKEMMAQVKSEYVDGENRKAEKTVYFSEVSGGDLMQTSEDAFGAAAKNLFANFTGVSKW